MDAATLLKEARQASGLTQAELAERSATSQATLSAYERGHKQPSAATLARIMAATGHQLTATPTTRPVRTPGAEALGRAGRTLLDVLELAAMLPSDHSANKALFPGLPPPAAER